MFRFTEEYPVFDLLFNYLLLYCGNGIQEVSGSIPLISTNTNPWKPSVSKDFFALGGNRAQRGGNWPTTFLTTL